MGGALSLALAAKLGKTSKPLDGKLIQSHPNFESDGIFPIAVISFYGTPSKNFIDISEIPLSTPVQAHFGQNDSFKGFSDSETALELDAVWTDTIQMNRRKNFENFYRPEAQVFVYPQSGHAFMNEIEMQRRINAQAKYQATLVGDVWKRVGKFFREKLKNTCYVVLVTMFFIFRWIYSFWWLYTSLPLLTAPFFLFGFISLVSYLVPALIANFVVKPQNLKTKYNAKWALVTGQICSMASGIGAAIVRKCAAQGLNVVIVALDDNLLTETAADVTKEFPDVEFRTVGADLSGIDYMDNIIRATSDIEVQLVFNNAGYIRTGLFGHLSISTIMKNYDCNSTNYIYISHHFLNLMRERGQKGLLAYTASSGCFVPTPMTIMYGSTKVFVAQFAASLAPELYEDGIEVCCVHPSPTKSRFYDSVSKELGIVAFFERTSVGPEQVADAFFSNAGRFTIVDFGYFSVLTKIMFKLIDWNFFAEIMKIGIRVEKDYQRMKSEYAETIKEKLASRS
ncbi:hypothetical protein HK096_004478 [Nowakowskiella sp. JEL0078]|nr:hypothetical protein HK096_004478 [Nowakowskiella sp. JEL0078]